MASLNQNKTSAITFQNNYMRNQVGAPVVPILKSIQLGKRPFCELCNCDYKGSHDAHLLDPLHKNNVSSRHTDLNRSSIITNENVVNPISLPLYNPDNSYGEEMLLPINGYYCMICNDFFGLDDSCFKEHCKSKEHFDKYIEVHNELQFDHSVDRDKKPLVNSGSNYAVTTELNNNPLPIKIKIENTESVLINYTNKKPLSERLGAVKKNNKHTKRLKSKKINNDGNINDSMRQFLPKPSSHITPSRKVFVDNYDSNIRSNSKNSKS